MQRYLLPLLALPFLLVGNTTIQSNICENPTTPVIITPTANSVLFSQTTIMSGTATASSTVTITDNDQPAASVMSDVNGEFSVQLTLVDGQNQLTAQVSNPCGISAISSETITAIVPVAPPPTIPPAAGGGGGGSSGGGTVASGGGGSGKTTPPANNGGSQSAGSSTTTPSTSAVPLRVRITAPADHLVTSDVAIFVIGTTSMPATERVTVNGTQVAMLYSSTDTFGVAVPLNLGTNTIQIVATANGKTTTTQITVTRIRLQPLPKLWHDGAIAIAVAMLVILLVGLILARRRKRQQS